MHRTVREIEASRSRLPEPGTILNTGEVAALLGVSQNAVRGYIASGSLAELPRIGEGAGHRYRITAESVRDLFAALYPAKEAAAR